MIHAVRFLPLAALIMLPVASVRAEVLFATDFSGYVDGPLAGQHGWTDTATEQGGVSVLSGSVIVNADGESRTSTPEFAAPATVYYGFDVTVQRLPRGNRAVFTGLRAGEWSRAEFMIRAPRGDLQTLYTAFIGASPEDVTPEFELGLPYRVVVAAGPSGTKLWLAQDPVEDSPIQQVAAPVKGPFTGFYFRAQKGEALFDNLVIATTFAEAADRAVAARPAPEMTPAPASQEAGAVP